MTSSSRRAIQLLGIGAVLIAIAAARNADPTFAEDVAPILYKNCASCHRTGGLAPFSVVE
jgi:hypothetical protein